MAQVFRDINQFFSAFSQELERNKPDRTAMENEIKFLDWHVRPMKGDAALLIEKQDAILDALWKLTKLSELVNNGDVAIEGEQPGDKRIVHVHASIAEDELLIELVPQRTLMKKKAN